MFEFEFLVFVNGAKQPIAGFAFKDLAIAWAEQYYSGKYEIRETKADDR